MTTPRKRYCPECGCTMTKTAWPPSPAMWVCDDDECCYTLLEHA